jgi:hypothetical protein
MRDFIDFIDFTDSFLISTILFESLVNYGYGVRSLLSFTTDGLITDGSLKLSIAISLETL